MAVDLGADTSAADEGPDGDLVQSYFLWLQLERGRQPNTIAAYRRDLAQYRSYLLSIGASINSATEADISGFSVWLASRGLAQASVKRMVVSVRNLHKYLALDGLISHDSAAQVEIPGQVASVPKALTEQQVSSILDGVQGVDWAGYRDRAILEVLYGTGIRVSELCDASIPDLDLGEALLSVTGKGNKQRLVPVGRIANAALTDWLSPLGRDLVVPAQWKHKNDSDALFLNARGGRLTRQGVWGVVRKHAETVGLEHVVHPHVFRHCCATHMLDHGADIRTVQELLGHASLSTTQIYTKVSLGRLQSAYQAAHPRALAMRKAGSDLPRH